MMARCHATHIGIGGCLHRAWESMYWPRMSVDLKDYVARCDVCPAHRESPPKETLLLHELTSRPLAEVGANLCELNELTLLVVCDYFNGFIEVELTAYLHHFHCCQQGPEDHVCEIWGAERSGHRQWAPV